MTGAVFVAGVTQTFNFPNDTESTTYRLNVSANNGHASRLSLYEMEYFTNDNDSSRIFYPSGEFLDTPDYDLILKISQGQTAARFVQYPGFAEILAEQSPGDTFADFQTELEAKFGEIQLNRSWFARLYRQTAEGIRSAPQAATTVTI